VSFSINTNIASLQSRQYLEQTNNYLSRTFRILSEPNNRLR